MRYRIRRSGLRSAGRGRPRSRSVHARYGFGTLIAWTALALAFVGACAPGADPVEPESEARAEEPLAADAPATETSGEPVASGVIVEKGMRIEFTATPVHTAKGTEPALRENSVAEVRFRVTDDRTGEPVSPLRPAAWVSRTRSAEQVDCRERIGRYVQGMLSFQADVDLNKFFLLILNNDQSISVVDPLLGVSGITQLYAMIVLEDEGEDWVMAPAEERLYVSMPDAGKVAVVDLSRFEVIGNIETGGAPRRLALQPDGRYLWVGVKGIDGGKDRLIPIDLETESVAGEIEMEPGDLRIDFSDDGLTAFAGSDQGGELRVIDIQTLAVQARVPMQAGAAAVRFSKLGDAAYAASAEGELISIDARTHELRGRRRLATGIAAMEIDPSGRFLFVADRGANKVHVLDAATDSELHEIEVAGAPTEIRFTDNYAYVRHLETAETVLIPLARLSEARAPAVQRVPLGSKAPGEYAYPALAPALTATGEATSIVSVNPADRLVYYYMEGMIAPMGSYTTYGRIPRAVGVVDRSVREVAPGEYAARFRVPESGEYNVALMIDTPFVGTCFAFDAKPDPVLAAQRSESGAVLDFLDTQRSAVAGQAATIRFSLKRPSSLEPLEALRDVHVMATRLPGAWRREYAAKHLGGGNYEAQIQPDASGVYYVSIEVPSLGLRYNDLPFLSLTTRAKPLAAKGS